MTTVDPTLPDLRARQAAAVEESGWGERLRLFQPRNAMFWLYLWAVVVGALRTVELYRDDVGSFGGALVGGSIAFALYGGLWLLFLGSVNRYTTESPKLLGLGVAWGFFVATMLIALPVNNAVLSLYAKTLGQSWTSDWGAGLTAPFTEETAKALGFVVLLGLAPRLIRSAYDAFVIGAFIGLGFQISENVLYVYEAAQNDFGTNEPVAAIQVIALRSAVGIASHALFSAIFCTGLFWLLGRGTDGRRLGRGLGLMVLAMVFHGVWDSQAALGSQILDGAGLFLLTPLFLAVEILGVVYVARLAAPTERRWMHDLLAPEVASGVVTEAEVDALAGSRHHQRTYVRTIHGHHDRTTAKHVIEAAHDLAEQLARSHGTDTDEVRFARSEITRLRALAHPA